MFSMQVFVGFMCDQAKVLMRTILLYAKPDMPKVQCVWPSCPTECDHLTALISHMLHSVCLPAILLSMQRTMRPVWRL